MTHVYKENVTQGIIAHPTHHRFHDGSKFEEPVFLHVVLTVANHSLCTKPNGCREPRPHPILFFPITLILSITAMAIGECCLRLDGIVQVEPIIHKGLPELFQNVFSCEPGSCTKLGIWPCSPCPFIEMDLLFFPCFLLLLKAQFHSFF